MSPNPELPVHQKWAHFRFSVIGPLLAAPPPRGELQKAIGKLAERQWRHPIHGDPVQFSFSTLERWYYQALGADLDPVGILQRKVRRDRGRQVSISEEIKRQILAQYARHPHWSKALHYDNLAARLQRDGEEIQLPSYATLRRFMNAHGLYRQRRKRAHDPRTPNRAGPPVPPREVRSYQADRVHALFHTDFHEGSIPVLTPSGTWQKPLALGVLDDCSRLCCHLQWYLSQTSEVFVHGLCQAFQKRSLPRALMSDNGSAMKTAEVVQGLARLGVVAEYTLPYSPHQNGKQESFWGQLEGRLIAMLDGCKDLSLEQLNRATQAWAEVHYNRKVHRELGRSPLEVYQKTADVGRPCPDPDTLRLAFTMQQSRAQRKSDGTVSIEGRRYELPVRFRHLDRVDIRYARWDLSRVYLVDGRTSQLLARIFPQDKHRNARGRRRTVPPPPQPSLPEPEPETRRFPPLLEQLIDQYEATGLPPAFLPLPEPPRDEEGESDE